MGAPVAQAENSNGAESTATRGCVLPRASLVLTITTAQKIFAISSSRDKISCHNFARLSAWCWRALHASGIFQIFHLSFRATARESSQQAYFAPLDCHVTTFVAPRNDKMVGTPTPDCHVERSRNISWKGNDVNCRKIVCLVGAPLAQSERHHYCASSTSTLQQIVFRQNFCIYA